MALILYEWPEYEGSILDFPTLPPAQSYPEASYILTPSGQWYVRSVAPRSITAQWFLMLEEGVPNSIRIHAMLLSAAI